MPVDRRFVVVGHKVVTDAGFNINDLCGSTGRLDVLLRCVNSTFFVSYDMRRDTELYLILLGEPDPPKCIRMAGKELRYVNPDERSTGALIRNALLKYRGREEMLATPGLYVSRMDFEEVINTAAKDSQIVCLDENGEDILKNELEGSHTFVLGDYVDLTDEEKGVLEKAGARFISLGPHLLHANHCITLVHNALDRTKV